MRDFSLFRCVLAYLVSISRSVHLSIWTSIHPSITHFFYFYQNARFPPFKIRPHLSSIYKPAKELIKRLKVEWGVVKNIGGGGVDGMRTPADASMFWLPNLLLTNPTLLEILKVQVTIKKKFFQVQEFHLKHILWIYYIWTNQTIDWAILIFSKNYQYMSICQSWTRTWLTKFLIIKNLKKIDFSSLSFLDVWKILSPLNYT